MKVSQTCPGCGAALPEDRLAGFCPACTWRELSEPDDLDATVVAPQAESLLSLPGHEVVGELARGGMSIVYRARQLEPRREVALKMLLPHQQLSPEMCERFHVETQAIASLDHPAILPLYQVGERDGMAFYTMKLAAGGSLAARRDQYLGQFREIGELIATLADAVQYAHERGVLHRDLKPGNVLFDETNRPYVSDFGLAKIVTTDTNLTLSTTLLGTPSYLAPEVAAHSARRATIASDVYALGAMLYELLAGRPPFEAESLTALVKQIVDDEPVEPLKRLSAETLAVPAVQRFNAAANHDLQVICLKCLAKEPARRYASAGALAEDLRRWLAGEAIRARRISAPERLWLWARRHRATAAALGLAAILLVALVVGLTISALRVAASRREALHTIEALEAQKANDLMADGSTAEGIALLARRVRQNPENWADTARLMWALHRRRWAVPVQAPFQPGDLVNPEFQSGQGLIRGRDERWLVVYVGTNVVIRDLFAGTNRHEWPLPFKPKRVAIQPAGQLELANEANRVWTRDVFTGRLAQDLATPAFYLSTTNLRVVPHSEEMAFIVAPDHSGRLVNPKTGKSKMLVPAEPGVSHYPGALFLPENRLAFSDHGRIIRVLNYATGEFHGPGFTASQRPGALHLSPDGRVVATRTQDDVQFWDLESGREFPVPAEVGVKFEPGNFRRSSGAQYYLAGNRSGLVIFDVHTGQLLNRPARGALLQGDCNLDSGGRFVFVLFDQCVGVFDAETGKPVCEPIAHNPMQKGSTYVVQDSSRDHLLTAGQDGLTVLWAVKTNRASETVLRHADGLQSARFSPDGRRVVTACHDGKAQIWDAHDGKPIGPPLVHQDKVWSAVFSPDGRRVATASWDASARLWDAVSGAPLSPPLRASNYVFHVEFSPDGSLLLACGEDRVVRLYDGHSGQFVRALPHPSQVYWAQYSPDGRMIVTRPHNHHPRLYDAASGEMLRELVGPPPRTVTPGVVTRGEFSRDGEWLTIGSPYHSATVWHLPEGRLQATLNHAASVRTARFSPDARTILTTANDLTARLWDARTGKPLSPPLTGQRRSGARTESSQAVRAGVIHPNGRFAATGGSDGVLRLWDLRNGLSLGEAEFNASVMDAEFSPDGQRLLVACFDGSAHILTLPPLLDRAPDWLAPLAEGLVYQRYDEHGASQNLSPVALWEACERLRRAPPDEPGVRWARALLDF